MLEYCVKCNKKHESNNWQAWYEKELRKVVYMCDNFFKVKDIEWVPESTKLDRVKNAKSMIQPWRSGEPSAEYIKAYPESSKKMFSLRERMTAKDVWKDTLPSSWEKTQ
jgi:ketol-acid reductoisomerase